MQVRRVRVGVRQGLVPVRVGVRRGAGGPRPVLVPVMLVVHVGVVVLHLLVRVLVVVRLAQ